MLAVWAYAYEIMDTSLVDDHTYDMESLKVDLSISTGNTKMDRWFRKHFDPSTGQWVTKHPDKHGLHRIYESLIK